MADSIVRLKVESSEYDSKLKRASEGLTRYIEGCRKVGGTLEVVEADTLKYVQALGQMETKSNTAKGRLNEMTKAFTDLSVQFNHLTSEEKSSQFGQAMSASLEQLKGRIVETKQELNTIGQSIGDAGMGQVKTGASGVISTMGSMSMAIQGVYNGMSAMSGAVSELTEAYGIQEQAELKLETIMHQRMNASDADIQSIKNLAAEQQRIGVIGDEVQLAGAQQVATFLSQKKSIEELLPAMNNLAVQRQGLNVTSEEMVSIGNMVGKVMQGNVGALTRVGITFDEAQEKAIKYGTEEQRAAALAEVINNNVGQMNRTLANTDAGKAKQMANNFGDVQEELGRVLARWEPFLKSFSQIGMIAMGVGQVGNAIIGMTRAIISLTASQTISNLNTRMATSIVNGLSIAFTGSALAADTANVAIKGVTWTLRALEVATGIGIAIAAISTAVELLGDKMSNTTTSADAMSNSMVNVQTRAEALKDAQNSVTQSVNDEKTQIQDLTGIIHSNTASYKDKQNAISKLKSIVPDYIAKIDAEGTVHDNASVAISNHIHMLDLLQRAIAAYNTGQKIQQQASDASFALSQANDKVNTKQNNVNAVDRELNTHHDTYYGTRAIGGSITGAVQYVTAPTEAGNKKLQERETQVAALNSARDQQRQAAANNREAQRQLSGLGKWREDYVLQGLTGKDRQLGQRVLNLTMLNHGDYTATSNALFGRHLSPSEVGTTHGGGTATHHGSSNSGGSSRGGSTTSTTSTPAPKSDVEKNNDAIKEYTAQYVELQKEREKALNSGDTQKAAQIAGRSHALQIEIAALKERNAQYKEWEDKADGNAENIVDPNSLKGLNNQLAELKKNQDLSTTHEQWQKWQTDIDGVQKKIDAITGKTDKKDFSSLTTSNISGFISDMQQQLGQMNIGTIDYTKILNKEQAATEFQQVIQEALNSGMDPSQFGDIKGIWSKILNGENIDEDIQTFIDKLNEALANADMPTISLVKSEDGDGSKNIEKQGKDVQVLGKNYKEAANAAQTLGSAMAQIKNPAAQILGTIAQAVANVALACGEAILQFSQTGNPWAWIAFAATATAEMITTISSIHSATGYARGGIVHAANGATMSDYGTMVPGNSYSGDLIPARINSGELILNRAQQGNLAAQLDGMAADNVAGSGRPYVSGENIYIALNTYMKRRGLGEITAFKYR